MRQARHWLVLAAAIVAYELVGYRRGTGSPLLTLVGVVARWLR